MGLIEPEIGPGQFRDIVRWDVRAIRDFHPCYLVTGKRAGYAEPMRTTVEISVEFDNDDSATEFETRVRAMFPGVK